MSADTSHKPIDTTLQTGNEMDLDEIINGTESLTKDIINETGEKVKKSRKKKKKNKKKKSQEASIDTTNSSSSLQNDKTLNLDSIIVGIEEYLQNNVEVDVPVNINKGSPETDAQVKDTSSNKDNSASIPVKYSNNVNISDNQDSIIENNSIAKNIEENTGCNPKHISSDDLESMLKNTSVQENNLINDASNKSKTNKKHKKKKKNKNKKNAGKPSEENNSMNKDNGEKKDDIIAVTPVSNTDNDECMLALDIKENEESTASQNNSPIDHNSTVLINNDTTINAKETQKQPIKNTDRAEQSNNDITTDHEISASNKLINGNNDKLIEKVEDATSGSDKNESYQSELKEINIPKSQVQADDIFNDTAVVEDATVDTTDNDIKSPKEYLQQKIEEYSEMYGSSQLKSGEVENMVNTRKEHTALPLSDTKPTLVNTEQGNSLVIKEDIQEPLGNDSTNQKESVQQQNEDEIPAGDDFSETKSSKNCDKEDSGKQLNLLAALPEKSASESGISGGITENSTMESNKLPDEDSNSIKSLSNDTDVTKSANLKKQKNPIKLEMDRAELEIPHEKGEEQEPKEIPEKLGEKESTIEEQTCTITEKDSTDVLDSVEGLSLPEDKNNSLPQGEHNQPGSSQPRTITNTSLDDLFAETEAMLNNLEYVDDSELNQLLGIDKNSNGKKENTKNILKSSEIEEMNKQEPVYIYTSLAGGGFHMIPRTNRLATILQANRIEFTYRDLGTDADARKVWKTFSHGRTLPAVVRGRDTIVGNWEEMDQFNEEYYVRQAIYEAL